MSGESTQGIWIDAGSWKRAQYDKHVLRHPHGKPQGRANSALIWEAVLSLYPDAVKDFYRGGVLRFRWNGGEGSGEAFNGATTPGPVVWERS